MPRSALSRGNSTTLCEVSMDTAMRMRLAEAREPASNPDEDGGGADMEPVAGATTGLVGGGGEQGQVCVTAGR
jgi:hypothetical protein